MFGKNCKTYKMWKAEWKRFNSVPYDLDVVNLGSSGDANNFDYDLWKIRGYNLASAPQDMYYDNQVLEQYREHLKKGAKVIICLSEFALLVDKYEADCQNYKYYGFMGPHRIPNYSRFKSFLIKQFPGVLDKRLLKMEFKEFLKKILKWDERKKIDHKTMLSERSVNAIKLWKEEFGWSDEIKLSHCQLQAIERSWEILMKDIEYCQEHDLQPLILIPPFNRHLMEKMPNEILDECLWKYVRKAEDGGVRVISFWDDKELQADELYLTLACLNEEGKKLFNKKVQDTI